jgi:hypothetical protein
MSSVLIVQKIPQTISIKNASGFYMLTYHFNSLYKLGSLLENRDFKVQDRQG